MTITHVQDFTPSANTQFGNSTCTLGTAATVGNYLVVEITTAGDGSGQPPGGSVPTGGGVATWIHANGVQDTTTGQASDIFYGLVTTSGQTVVTCVLGTHANNVVGVGGEFATSVGSLLLVGAAPVDGFQAGSLLYCPGFFVRAGQLYVGGGFHNNAVNSPYTPSIGTVFPVDPTAPPAFNVGAWFIAGSDGTQQLTFTATGSGTWAASGLVLAEPPLPSGITVIQSTWASGASPQSAGFGVPLSQPSWVIAGIGSSSRTATVSTITGGSTWVKDIQHNTDEDVEIWHAPRIVAGSVITATLVSAASLGIGLLEASLIGRLLSASGTSGTSTTPTTPTVTNVPIGALVVATANGDGGGTTLPSGWASVEPGSWTSFGVDTIFKVTTAAGSVSAAWGQGSSANWETAIAVYLPNVAPRNSPRGLGAGTAVRSSHSRFERLRSGLFAPRERERIHIPQLVFARG